MSHMASTKGPRLTAASWRLLFLLLFLLAPCWLVSRSVQDRRQQNGSRIGGAPGAPGGNLEAGSWQEAGGGRQGGSPTTPRLQLAEQPSVLPGLAAPKAGQAALADIKQKQPVAGSGKVSVVMLNWKRPANVIKIAMHYVRYDSVEEIVIWMCHPDKKFTLVHPKVRIIDDVSADQSYGLSTRFKACLMAKSPWVLIQDDDHYLKERGLQKLISSKKEHPQRMVGTFGRDWPAAEPPQYIRSPVAAGPCRILLTILLLTDQLMCQAFWDYAPLVQDYVHKHSRPLWNGEDIFLSLVSYKATGQVPLVVGKVPKVFMSQRNTGVHLEAKGPDFVGHDTYRDQFLRYAVEALQLEYGESEYGRQVKRGSKLPHAKAKQRRG